MGKVSPLPLRETKHNIIIRVIIIIKSRYYYYGAAKLG